MSQPGCQVQNAAIGNADSFLTIDPQITFFKQLYKRHTRFAIGELDEPFLSPNFGKQMVLDFPRAGDLLHQLYVRYHLTALKLNLDTPLTSENGTNVTAANAVITWSNSIGNVLTKEFEVQIGSQTIDKLFSEYLQLWEDVSAAKGREQGEAIGQFDNVDDLRAFAARDRDLYVNIPVFFSRYPELSLPLIALQYHNVRFILTTRRREDCIVAYLPGGSNDGSDWAIPYARIDGGEMTECYLTAGLVYLDTMEREIFASEQHEYLYSSLQQQPADSIVAGTTSKTLNLTFNLPVIELFWLYQESRNSQPPLNNHFNYGVEDPLGNYPWNAGPNVPPPLIDPIKTAKLTLNSQDRIKERDAMYFRTVQPRQYHTKVPSRFIYNYSFGLHPEDHAPSGSCNMSRIDHVQLLLKFATNPNTGASALTNTGEVRTYARSYNVLKVAAGMAAKRYAS